MSKHLLAMAVMLAILPLVPALAGESVQAKRSRAEELRDRGDYRDALALYKELALDKANTPADAAGDMENAIKLLPNQNELAEADGFIDQVVETWDGEWEVAMRAASLQSDLPTWGRIIAGKFRRASYDSGPFADASNHDRVKSIALMLKAEAWLDNSPVTVEPKRIGSFYHLFANIMLRHRTDNQSWRLTELTDVSSIPDLEEGIGEAAYRYAGRATSSAPVDKDGNPVFYSIPESWDKAGNDGERWRWALAMAARRGSSEDAEEAAYLYASFLEGQFGVQTMDGNYLPMTTDSGEGEQTGPYAVRTLKDDETIARLATGIKRFTLPAEHNYIKIYEKLTREGVEYKFMAMQSLALEFENRQQYVKAAEWWRALDNRPSDPKMERKWFEDDLWQNARDSLNAITGNLGRIEPVATAPAGTRATLPYLYRNGKSVKLTAYRLDDKQLILDVKDKLKQGKLKNLDLNIENIGGQAVRSNQKRYVKEKVAEWAVPLEPLGEHRSRRTYLEMPFSEAGAYLVIAKMENGNTSRVVFWQADLALVSKPLQSGQLFYVADALNGAGVDKATVSFFGYGSEHDDNGKWLRVATEEFAEFTNADGLLLVTRDFNKRNRNWLTMAETRDGRLAYLGFTYIWPITDDEQAPEETANRSFVIADRPVYRPDQKVCVKAWTGDQPGRRGLSVHVTVTNPMGETIYEKTLTTDQYGGVAAELTLDGKAPLGHYAINTQTENSNYGYGYFRLEEYKKPEFEVTVDAPDAPLALGDVANVTVNAKYYFGSPVANAKISYKVLRTPQTGEWFPPCQWDWLYGRGYSWTAYDYTWLPGWDDWGTYRPTPSWFSGRGYAQPEVVAEGEGALDADGTFKLPVDTAPAKELYGNQDHNYAIAVEVTDQSRRTVVGQGSIVAARKPFKIVAWGDRGYYQTGQEINASFMALDPLGKGVKGTGKATLYKIRYNDKGEAREGAVESWDVASGADGKIELRLKAAEAGQYRLACELADAGGRKAEGAAVLAVRGDRNSDGDFRFADLELVPDKQEYRPGESIKLAVNAANKKAVVLLFPLVGLPKNGKEAMPTILTLENGTAIADIPVSAIAAPNFFCEAITICDGKVYSELRQIFVPPANQALTVEVKPDADSYGPGKKALFEVLVKDADGKPVAGQCVVSLYDKSIEYISGGSNVGDIKQFFFNWKRHYSPSMSVSLNRHGRIISEENDQRWTPIGVFGNRDADWNPEAGGNGDQRLGYVENYSADDVAIEQESVAYYAETSDAPMASRAMPILPSAAAPEPARRLMAPKPSESKAPPPPAGGTGAMAEAEVRSEFADTALWIAALETDAAGKATFSLDMPDNLTAWKARVWTKGAERGFGDGQAEVTTRKNVIVRPQTPRFLTQKDQVVLSANLHNYLPRAKDARVELSLEGGMLAPEAGVELIKTVRLAANGEERVDWLVKALRPGTATVRVKLLTDEESDAAEVKVPVIVHGMRKLIPFSGALRDGDNPGTIEIDVPAERLTGESRLEVRFSPTLATSMLDAVPYLIEYPYGCTEQTLNRFLPAVMVRNYLETLGVSLSDVRTKQDNPDAAAYGKPGGRISANPVFDDAKLDDIVKTGVERLTGMQNADGGWGWFSGPEERSWPHTTAVVVHGLLQAEANGVAIVPEVLERGVSWLRRHQDEEIVQLKRYLETDGKKGKANADNTDALIYMILAEKGYFNPDMRDFLYRDRLGLSLSGLAMFGIALDAEKATNALATVVGNIDQYVKYNDKNQTAWLELPRGGWWWWYNDEIEAAAWTLKLLSRIEPQGRTAAGMAKYLLNNRKNATYWRSTRDTAYAIEALSAFAKASGETAPDMTVSLFYDGAKVMEKKIGPDTILDENLFVLEGVAVETGRHEIRIERSGKGPLYYGAGLDLFSLEDPIAKAGLDITIKREIYRLVKENATASAPSATGRAVGQKVEKYRRERIPSPFDANGGTLDLKSGDLVEVELTIEAANDYEYIMIEDMKAAGCEAVEVTSGYNGNSLGAYVEYRDQKVTLFSRYLPRGTHSVGYRLRAETPGSFSALPAVAAGMYATDLRANSDEGKVRIVEPGVFE